MCGIQLPIQKRVNAFGLLHCLGTSLGKELLITESRQKGSRALWIWHVAKLTLNARDNLGRRLLNKRTNDRHDNEKRDGPYGPAVIL